MSPWQESNTTERKPTPRATIVFLLLVATVFFADGVRFRLEARDPSSLPPAEKSLRSADHPALVVLHIGSTDYVAHQYGTERPEYRERLRQVDAQVHRFFESVADPGTTFIVTADHGCDLYGSHGGTAD